MGFGGISKEQIRVLRYRGVPYHVLLDRNHSGMIIPKNVVVQGNSVLIDSKIVKQYDLSQGIGNPHVARDAITTSEGIFIRGTLRHQEHRMSKMGNIWHKVYKNTAINSWSADGNVD